MSQRLMTPRILWGALLASTAMFLVVLFVNKNPHPEPIPLMPPLFGLLALAIAVVSLVLPAHTQKTALAQRDLDITEAADPNASSIIPDREAPKRRVFANPEQADRVAFATYQTGLILGCALSEAIALFGFVIGFLGHPLPVFLPFFVLSWVLFAVRFPTLARVRRQLEKAKSAVFP